MKARRTMAKAGNRYVLKKDVEKLLHIVRGLKGGTQESFWNAAVQASELQEQIHRTSPPDTSEAVTKMAVPGGRLRLSSFVEGVRQQIRGTPPSPPNPFRLAPVGQRRIPPPIDEKEVRRAFAARRKRLVKKSGASPSNRGTARERAEASEALEKNLLRQLREQQGRRLDLFGRKIRA